MFKNNLLEIKILDKKMDEIEKEIGVKLLRKSIKRKEEEIQQLSKEIDVPSTDFQMAIEIYAIWKENIFFLNELNNILFAITGGKEGKFNS